MCSVPHSHPTLCDLVDCSPPGSSVHGILQARILEWVAMPPSGDLLNPGAKPASLVSPSLVDRFFTTSATGKLQGVVNSYQAICGPRRRGGPSRGKVEGRWLSSCVSTQTGGTARTRTRDGRGGQAACCFLSVCLSVCLMTVQLP